MVSARSLFLGSAPSFSQPRTGRPTNRTSEAWDTVGSAGIFSRRTNRTSEAWVYTHDGPIGRRKRGYTHDGPIGRRNRGYILTTDQSDVGSA
eukprot:4010572-Pyramimonas_sp.AAC.1